MVTSVSSIRFSILLAGGLLLGSTVGSPVGSLAVAQTPPPTGSTGSGRSAAPASHTIRGKIFLPNGTLPDQRIRVTLELNTGGIAGETFSDSVGNFEFRSLPSNSYRVTVPGDNRTYETTQDTVEAYGNFARTFMVQIYLREKGADKPMTREKLLSAGDMQDVPKAAKKPYDQGLKLVKDHKYEEAIAHFQQAIKLFPDYLLALNKLGEQYLALKKVDDARASFERALAINPKFPVAQINLAMLLCRTNQYQEAIEHIETATRLDDSFPMAHMTLGIALMNNDPPDLARAEKELLRAREMGGPDLAYAHIYLYNICLKKQAWVAGADHLEMYLKEAPGAPNVPAIRDTLTKLRSAIASGSVKPAQPDAASSSKPATTPDPPKPAPEPPSKPAPETLAGLVKSSVVMVDAGPRQGSAFFVQPDVIATSYRLIKGAGKVLIRLESSDQKHTARIINTDPNNDLALLQLEEVSGSPLQLGSAVADGDRVFAIGLDRGVMGGSARAGAKLIQVNETLQPGAPGSPLLDAQGRVVGVASSEQSKQYTIAVPVSFLKLLMAATLDK
jgi:tetratricopeptide (TPR) repeat protein